ncbi:DUF6415 family natural product biosynthesis protein [Streptomyces acidicola]|uniref:DUF6415 family natural product biosynthesis protein n=1 Tax=Streptomyces acidicola TaxID=2596892 RepID=UPI0034467804
MTPWTPPLEREALATVLVKIREWQVFDGEALLDDVAVALDEVTQAEEDVEDIAWRLRGHLTRLVNIAVAAEAERRDEETARLLERARMVGSEEAPGDCREAVGYLRRMGWTANELLEQLVVTKYLKAAA